MKKIICLAISFFLLCSLGACSSLEPPKSPYDVEQDAVISAVKSRAITTMQFSYEITGSADVTIGSIKEVKDNVWEVSGKITVRDKYGDSYTGTYDAEVRFDSSQNKATVIDFDHTTPTKNK